MKGSLGVFVDTITGAKPPVDHRGQPGPQGSQDSRSAPGLNGGVEANPAQQPGGLPPPPLVDQFGSRLASNMQQGSNLNPQSGQAYRDRIPVADSTTILQVNTQPVGGSTNQSGYMLADQSSNNHFMLPTQHTNGFLLITTLADSSGLIGQPFEVGSDITNNSKSSFLGQTRSKCLEIDTVVIPTLCTPNPPIGRPYEASAVDIGILPTLHHSGNSQSPDC